jgi:hypothetical protein
MDSDASMAVTVLCAENRYAVDIQKQWTVGTFKHKMQTTVLAELSQGKILRVIFAGRLLNDDSETLDHAHVADGAVIHIALTDHRQAAQAQAPRAAQLFSNPFALAAGQAPAATTARSGDDNNTDASAEPSAPSHRLGFDRLQGLGLTAEDISVIRSTYLPDVQREMAGVELEEGESEAHRLLRMEDEWMRRQDAFSEFAMNLRPVLMSRLNIGIGPNGDVSRMLNRQQGEEEDDEEPRSQSTSQAQGGSGQLLFGIILGSLFGFVMLIWTIFPTVNRQFKMGILIGVSTNILMEVWQAQSSTKKTGTANGEDPTPNLRGGLYLDVHSLS